MRAVWHLEMGGVECEAEYTCMCWSGVTPAMPGLSVSMHTLYYSLVCLIIPSLLLVTLIAPAFKSQMLLHGTGYSDHSITTRLFTCELQIETLVRNPHGFNSTKS